MYGKRLVAADVECPQCDPPAGQCLRDRFVLRLLLVDAGRARPAEKQELGAYEAGSVGSCRERGPGIGHRSDIGDNREVRPVQGHRRLLREREVVGPALGQVRRPPAEIVQQLRRGIDAQLTGAAVQDDRRPFRDAEHFAAGRHDERDVACPREDRGMRGGAALGENDTEHEVGVQPGRFRGRQVAGDEDPFGHRLPGGLTGQCAQHLIADRVDVFGTLAQVRVR